MAVEGIRCRLHGTERGGLVTFQVAKPDRELFKKWVVEESKKKKAGKVRLYEVAIKLHRKKRTLDQNALYWSLVTILAYEVYGEFGWEEVLHEELLHMYAPRHPGKLSTAAVPVRSKDMDTVQFSRLVEGVFRELAVNGVDIESGPDIGRYWQEWMSWRGTQCVDPLSQTYRDRQDWMSRQTFCEACMRYIGPDKGTAAHIVSRGSGGSDELHNLMRLCDPCHMTIQHQSGWTKLISMYPHIAWRWRIAREKAGVPVVLEQIPEEDLKPREEALQATVEGIKEVFEGEVVENATTGRHAALSEDLGSGDPDISQGGSDEDLGLF